MNSTSLNDTNLNTTYAGETLRPYMGYVLTSIVLQGFALYTVSANLLIIVAVIKYRHLQSRIYIFTVNLAITDLLSGITLPIPWHFMDNIKYVNSKMTCVPLYCLIWTCVMGNLLAMILSTFDRYLYIMHPLKYETILTKPRCAILIALSWVVAFILGIILMFWNDYESVAPRCGVRTVPYGYATFIFIPLFLILTTMVFILNLRVYRAARAVRLRIHDVSVLENDSQSSQVEDKAAKAVGIIIITFVVCWTPLVIVLPVCLSGVTVSILIDVVFVIAYFNSGMNVIVYAAKNRDFRQAFKKLLSCQRGADVSDVSWLTHSSHFAASSRNHGGNSSKPSPGDTTSDKKADITPEEISSSQLAF